MTSSTASTSRTCPVCGARNSGISLFCAECGSSLIADAHRAGDTTAIPIQRSEAQHTEPYSLAASGSSERWRSVSETERGDETAAYRPASSIRISPSQSEDRWNTPSSDAATGALSADTPLHDRYASTVETVEGEAPSTRGFFLGLLALFLIAIIVGMYAWTAWLSPDLRETLSGWFDAFR